jgi:hypothetical protein
MAQEIAPRALGIATPSNYSEGPMQGRLLTSSCFLTNTRRNREHGDGNEHNTLELQEGHTSLS